MPRPRRPRLHDFVRIIDCMWSHWGQIVQVVSRYRCGAGQDQERFLVKFMSNETGRLLDCPDSRCAGACVGCSRGCWADEVEVLDAAALKLYIECGILLPETLHSRRVYPVLPQTA